MYAWWIYIWRIFKESATKVFMFAKAKCKVWLIFLQAKQQQELPITRLRSLKTIKDGNIDVFLG